MIVVHDIKYALSVAIAALLINMYALLINMYAIFTIMHAEVKGVERGRCGGCRSRPRRVIIGPIDGSQESEFIHTRVGVNVIRITGATKECRQVGPVHLPEPKPH